MLETQGSRTGSDRAAGFSLLELMIALAVLGMAAAIVVLNLDTVSKSERLRKATRKLSGLSNFVRSNATNLRQECFIEFDLVKNSYRWGTEPLRDEYGRYVDVEDGHVLSPEELEEWLAGFYWEELPRDVYFGKLFLSRTAYYDKGIVKATYYPTGTSQSYILWLRGALTDDEKDDAMYSVVVNGLTGQSEVVSYAAQFPEAAEGDFSAVMGPDAPGGRTGGDR